MSSLRRFALVTAVVVGLVALLATAGATARTVRSSDMVEVVVTLPQAPLAEAPVGSRGLSATSIARTRLNLRAPASVSYLRSLAAAQRQLAARVTAAIPEAQVRWHYSVVANGIAVVVPRTQLERLRSLGATVWPSITYHALLNRTPQLIGAPTVWGPTLATAGQGIKIAILDDGVDQTHIFFDPTGFTYPAGFPKGNTSYTTPKVIVARAFAPATPEWQYADTPFDPKNSEHATNVAGIAAGDHGTIAQLSSGRFTVSGIAPMAYLGNYKVLTIPTTDFGLDGNSPEILAGIEQAVRDGMDVINLSLGEPEVEPTRDIVVKGLNAAAAAGVVPVVAAGNDFGEAGHGSISSPANAAQAIAVAASTEGDAGPADEIADFSSGGPTPISLELKPDVTAPGVDLLSSLPGNRWSEHSWSGTSMATPHVSGAVAVLKQRHPTWTVEQIKSALESTGDPVHPSGSNGEVLPTREGGGRIDLPRADAPLIFTSPTSLSYGLVQRKASTTLQLAVTDGGSGAVPWTISLDPATAVRGATLTPTLPTVVPGTSVGFTLGVSADAAEGEGTGFILLTRALETRRVPYWFRVETPKLGTERQFVIKGPGLYGGDTSFKSSLVSSYRYPDGGLAPGLPTNLSGPEEVFKFVLKKPVANFGAVVMSHANGVRVSPRLVSAADENRLVGYAGLPVDLNPYAGFNRLVPAVGAILPAPGTFDFVFDTPAGAKPGRFTFRVWVDDTTPPTVRLLSPSVVRSTALRIAVTDKGSGVDPVSLQVKVDGVAAPKTFSSGLLRVSTSSLARGTHKITVVAADYQETKNMEDVGGILPNTRTFSASFVVR